MARSIGTGLIGGRIARRARLVGTAALLGALALPGPLRAAEAFFIQLASIQSEERARQEWARLQSRHGALLGDLELVLQAADLGARGTFYRLQAGPFPNRATARDMCRQLRAVELDCLVTWRE